MRAAVILVLICTVGSACLSFYLIERYDYKTALQFDSQEAKIIGRICETPNMSSSGCSIVVKTDSINETKTTTKIKLTTKTLKNFDYGNLVEFDAKIFSVQKFSNKTKNSYKSNNIYLTGYILDEDTKVVFIKKDLRSYALSLKQKMIDTINEMLPNDSGGLIIALVTGNTDFISGKAYNDFKITGVIHILSVSGMHFYYWAFFLFMLLCLMGIRERLSAAISIIVMFFFMTFFGFTPSVVRSGIMMIIYLSGYLFMKKPDSLNSLGISALIIAAFNPYTVLNIGTLFSFSASLGLVVIMPKVNQKIIEKVGNIKFKVLRKLTISLLLSIFVTVVASIFTFPISVFYIGSFSLLSVLANLPTALLTMPLMLLSGVGILFAMVPIIDFVSFPFMFISTYLSKWTLQIISSLAKHDYLFINVSTNVIKWSIFLVMIVIVLTAYLKIDFSKHRRSIALCCAILFVAMCFVDSIYFLNKKQLIVENVGDGLFVNFSFRGHCILIDGGGDYYGFENTISTIEKNTVKTIDVLISNRQYKTETFYSKELIENFEVKSLISEDETLLDGTKISIDSIYSEDEYNIKLWDDTLVEFRREKKCEYVFISSGDNTILIILKGQISDKTLPVKHLNPDIFITTSHLSYSGSFSPTVKYVLSAKNTKSIPSSVNKYHITGINGTAKITL